MPSCYRSLSFSQQQLLCSTSLPSPLPLQRTSTPSTAFLCSSPHPHTNKMSTHERSEPASLWSNETPLTWCAWRDEGAFIKQEKRNGQRKANIPNLAIPATDLPSPSVLFSHFTGRYWFPVLFFLLHVFVGPHLFLVQQAGSLEFTFLPDELKSRRELIISDFLNRRLQHWSLWTQLKWPFLSFTLRNI